MKERHGYQLEDIFFMNLWNIITKSYGETLGRGDFMTERSFKEVRANSKDLESCIGKS